MDELKRLLEKLPLKPDDRLVFLGDYIDRGPDSKGVVSHLIGIAGNMEPEPVFLKGNHEDMLLAYLGFAGNYAEMFLANGGQATLESYKIPITANSQDSATARMPAEHLQFFLALRNFYQHDSFLCVHAGIEPLKPLESQSNVEMLWIRNEFIANRHQLPYTVVFGHTPQKDVFFDLPSKIGIDTGVVYGGKLSCIELDDKILFQIDRGARQVRQISISHKWHEPASRSTP